MYIFCNFRLNGIDEMICCFVDMDDKVFDDFVRKYIEKISFEILFFLIEIIMKQYDYQIYYGILDIYIEIYLYIEFVCYNFFIIKIVESCMIVLKSV